MGTKFEKFICCMSFLLVGVGIFFVIFGVYKLVYGGTYSPIVGAVTENSAKLNAKIDVFPYYIEYSEIEGFNDFMKIYKTYSTNKNFIHLRNLTPETTYYYRIIAKSCIQDRGEFKTFPQQATSVKIGILTDLKSIKIEEPDPVYSAQALSADNPDFVLILGDFDHANAVTRTQMQAMYLRTRGGTLDGDTLGNHIFRQFPVAHVWDDHDYGDNNSNKYFSNKDLAIQMYDKFYPCYDRPYPKKGIWHKFNYGKLIEVFMLDLRSQRDLPSWKDSRYMPLPEPNPSRDIIRDDPNRSMLGNLQKEWLKQNLLNSTAKWKIIASTVPWNPTVPKDDAWWDFRAEQDELIKFIYDNNIRNIIIISGDLHTGGAIDNGANSVFPEINVAKLNKIGNGGTCHLYNPRQWLGCGEWSEGIIAQGIGYGLITLTQDSFLIESKNEFGYTIISLKRELTKLND